MAFPFSLLKRKDVDNMGFFSKLFSKAEKINDNHIYAPMAGQAVPVTEVPDPTFAEGMLGNGIAIIPADGKLYAPCNGTVTMMFETGHALTLTSNAGAEILIHVGLETVGLGGKPFKPTVKAEEKVKKGQLLMEVDLEMIKEAGLNTITPMLICNSDEYSKFNTNVGKEVTNADVVIELGK